MKRPRALTRYLLLAGIYRGRTQPTGDEGEQSLAGRGSAELGVDGVTDRVLVLLDPVGAQRPVGRFHPVAGQHRGGQGFPVGRRECCGTPRRWRVPNCGAVIDDRSDCSLGPYGWTGSVGPVAWDLRWGDSEITVTVPRRPLRHIKVLDVALSSYPRLRVSGSVHFAGQVRQLNELPGMRCHYWGRALPRRWTWLSANELMLLRPQSKSGQSKFDLRGIRFPSPRTGYAWTHVAG